MAEKTTVTLTDLEQFKKQALLWANHFKTVCLLDSNNYHHDYYKSADWILAADSLSEIKCGQNAFESLKKFQSDASADIFGFLSYDLKNQIEKLSSNKHDGIKFPDMYFFKPRYVLQIDGDKLTINRNYPETFHLIELIQNLKHQFKYQIPDLKLQPRTSKDIYIHNVESIRKQIKDGDLYEMNYCNEFYSENTEIDPVQTFLQLNKKEQTPFSCFFKLDTKYLLCASPERFLKKQGGKLLAQPIKGTGKKARSIAENEQQKLLLKNNTKEIAENVMIVDLMRNDLAKSSKAGSIVVDELFGIYEFNSLNQMISTVVSEAEDGIHCTDILKNAFPMGSMTGAPKVTVMENIEKYEDVKRGLFSGSVGRITPEGDFDFNVVIRSILYNSSEKYVSVQAGGAITYDSIAEKEYEEILLKTKGIMQVLREETLKE